MPRVVARPEAASPHLPSFAADRRRPLQRVPDCRSRAPPTATASLVTNAADPRASPFGWHDTNGAAGPEFFVTRGNNVHAYTDIDANNVADPGSDPIGGGTLTFDFPLDLTQQPSTYRPGCRHQPVLLEQRHARRDARLRLRRAVGQLPGEQLRQRRRWATTMCGPRRRTAAARTTPTSAHQSMACGHGCRCSSGRSPLPNFVTVHSPAGRRRRLHASRATVRPAADARPVSPAPPSLANDGVGPRRTATAVSRSSASPRAASRSSTGAPARSGSRSLTAQTAGAVGVIVANNVAGQPDHDGSWRRRQPVTIPAVMVSQEDGTLFKANLPLSVTLRSTRALYQPRLRSGRGRDHARVRTRHLQPPDRRAEHRQLSEQRRADGRRLERLVCHHADDASVGYADDAARHWALCGFQPADGDGIRPTPYTTDMTVNPSTYASVANVAQISPPHGIGYVWNTMLWEVYWNLVDRYGYNANIYGGWSTGGNNLALQLVMDGMKFQPCRPGFVDGRNAILQADMALTGGANQCEIWRGFAKRGLGVQRQPGLLDQPDRRRRGVRPARQLHGCDVRRVPSADRGCTGAERRECRRHRARQVHARRRRPVASDRLAAGGLHDAGADRRGAGPAGWSWLHRSDSERRRLPRQLENRCGVGGVVPAPDGSHTRGVGRYRVLQVPIGQR